MAGLFFAGSALVAAAGGGLVGAALRRFAFARRWWVQGLLVGGLGLGLGNGLGIVGALLLGAPLRLDPAALTTAPWMVGGVLATAAATGGAILAARVGGTLEVGRAPGWGWAAAGLPGALVVMAGGVAWMLTLAALGFEPEAQGLAQALATQDGWVRGLVLGFVVGVAPATEELFFRGWCQPLLRARFGARRAVVAQALLFGAVHTDRLWAVPPLVFIGLVCGWLRERSGSVVPGLVLHVVNNSVAAAG
jgi:membrane protease YdiL (CAAX protease family)